jgi:hypothetical protein
MSLRRPLNVVIPALPEFHERLRVSISYDSKILTRRRVTGQTTARPQCCNVAAQAGRAAIEAQVANRLDATIAELRAWLLEADPPEGGGSLGSGPRTTRG